VLPSHALIFVAFEGTHLAPGATMALRSAVRSLGQWSRAAGQQQWADSIAGALAPAKVTVADTAALHLALGSSHSAYRCRRRRRRRYAPSLQQQQQRVHCSEPPGGACQVLPPLWLAAAVVVAAWVQQKGRQWSGCDLTAAARAKRCKRLHIASNLPPPAQRTP
jgi:hypothetical protein